MRASPKQLTLAHWWHRPETRDLDGVIAEGAVRSGKTYAMIVGFLTWSRSEFQGHSLIVAGRSMGALRRNVVVPMEQVARSLGWRLDYNRSEGRIECGGNTFFLFGANNDRSQDVLQGMTAAGCLLDEVALMPESFVNQAIARCSVAGAKLWFNCNPSYPQHFFKTDFIDRADELGLLHLRFLMPDNPSLSPDTIGRYERMFSGVFHERYVQGLWTMAEGLVYAGWRDALEPSFTGDVVRRAVSVDYGTHNAFAALGFEQGTDGAWHCVREYRYSGRDEGHDKTDDDYVADMAALVRDWPDVPFIVDPSATSFITAMRRAGFQVRKARNDVADGIRETAACMQMGTVRIVEGAAPGLERELAGYVWDESRAGDVPLKREDHCCDALRYLVATMRVYEPPETGRTGSALERMAHGRRMAGNLRRA